MLAIPLTIWLEAHGAPGWLLGPGNPSDEDPKCHLSHQSEALGEIALNTLDPRFRGDR